MTRVMVPFGMMICSPLKVPFTMDADTVLEAVRLAAERACEGNPDVIEPPKLRGVTAFDQYGYEVTAAAKVKALTQWGCEWAIRREILREFAERGLEIASISGGAAPGQAEVRESEAAAAEPPTEA